MHLHKILQQHAKWLNNEENEFKADLRIRSSDHNTMSKTKKLTPWVSLKCISARIRLERKWADKWIGFYNDEEDIWFCLIPCLPLHLQFVETNNDN